MLRIVILVLVALVTLVSARPSYLHTPSVVPYGYELEPTVVGHTLHSIPTAVSHQSQTIVHEKRPYLRPIVEYPVPVLNTYAVPSQLVASPYGYNGWGTGYGGFRSASPYGGGWNQW